MNLYKVQTNLNTDLYWVVAPDLNTAEQKVIERLSKTFQCVIKVITTEFVANEPDKNTPDSFHYQYKLIT